VDARANVHRGAPAAAASGGFIGVFHRKQESLPPAPANDNAQIPAAPPSGPPLKFPPDQTASQTSTSASNAPPSAAHPNLGSLQQGTVFPGTGTPGSGNISAGKPALQYFQRHPLRRLERHLSPRTLPAPLLKFSREVLQSQFRRALPTSIPSARRNWLQLKRRLIQGLLRRQLSRPVRFLRVRHSPLPRPLLHRMTVVRGTPQTLPRSPHPLLLRLRGRLWRRTRQPLRI
jgi:hypothetical protein